jgi:hypothetical protein
MVYLSDFPVRGTIQTGYHLPVVEMEKILGFVSVVFGGRGWNDLLHMSESSQQIDLPLHLK